MNQSILPCAQIQPSVGACPSAQLIPILVSACLTGEPCRYDCKPCDTPAIRALSRCPRVRLIPFCPEMDGGLDAPRHPCEIQGSAPTLDTWRSVQVANCVGQDVTAPFQQGAQKALDLAKRYGVRLAICKEKSPTCASTVIYDGTFSGRLIPGMGLTVAGLRSVGVGVISDQQLDALLPEDVCPACANPEGCVLGALLSYDDAHLQVYTDTQPHESAE